MAEWYYYKVVNKTKLWTNVPSLWIEQVKEKLVKDGYTLNDDGTVSR